ncbi:hypothetical protein FHR32_005060 [Streptosporangium album]|uniref:Uncharacterized protein n=1 Tax=Streptosporangium album TaxID=47479 RepID=A0A7W7RYN8_9ACTN|nr:hypothetical protein [Streptosporangium album]MBB4940683.1 hypothetical protein [Streptosporangium album]
MNIHPSGKTLTLLAYAGWGVVAAEMIADVMPTKMFLGLAAMAGTLSVVAAIRHHEAVVQATAREHASTMGRQVLSADRLVTNRWRGETRAHIDAARAYADTGSHPVVEERTL